MKEVLYILLPKILPKTVQYMIFSHSGYGHLKKSIPVKLNTWRGEDVRFVIVQDQDTHDCRALKSEIAALCAPYHRDVLIRIACQELEAWYFGDLKAVANAYHKKIAPLGAKSKFRIPDKIVNPKEVLKKLIPLHEQKKGARLIAPFMDIDSNTSKSFNVFVSGVRAFCDCG